LINEAAYGGQRIVLTRHGKNIAAIVPISDLEMLHELEQILNVTTLPALKHQFEQRPTEVPASKTARAPARGTAE
jgi:prevent-host-death family protein